MGACDSFILKGDAEGYANCVVNALGLKSGDKCIGACSPFVAGALSISRLSGHMDVTTIGMLTRIRQRTCEAAFGQKGVQVRNPVSIGDTVAGICKGFAAVGAIAAAGIGIGAVVGGTAITGTAATIGGTVAGTVATAGKIGAGIGKGLSETVPAAQEPAFQASQREASNPCIVKTAYREKETPTIYEEKEPYRV